MFYFYINNDSQYNERESLTVQVKTVKDFFFLKNLFPYMYNVCYITNRTHIIQKGEWIPLIIHLEFESKTPIYIQLIHCIIAGIAKRELVPSERLPSVRSLAADIGINLHTVNKAYKELEQKGFIINHRQKGVVVNPEGVPKADVSFQEEMKEILHPLIAEAICRDVNKEDFMKLCEEIFTSYVHEGETNR